MLGLSCTCVLVALTPLYGSRRPWVIDCDPPLESLSSCVVCLTSPRLVAGPSSLRDLTGIV